MNNNDSDDLKLVNRDGEFIRKWFTDTTKQIEQCVHPSDAGDMVCVAAIAVSGNYAMAITDLLKLGHRMPVKALLRVLCELSGKLAWCMITPENRGKLKEGSIEKKLLQWEKSSLHKKLNIMEQLGDIVPEQQKQQLKENIEFTKERISQISGQPMPRTIEIFRKLSKGWRSGIYTRGYLQFNDAVHIDLGSLASTIDKQGKQININFDTDESLPALSGYCLGFMYQIIYLVRSHFGWDTNQMAKEFEGLGSEHEIYSNGTNEKENKE